MNAWLYIKKKRKSDFYVLERSNGRVSLTTNVWTSNQSLGYMCLTAHYIDSNWILRKKIVNFKLVPYPYSGLVIFDAIEGYIFYWNLKDKLFAITMDNCTTNDVVMKK
ncbi:hypothetical protein AMTRI_Chr10g3870 [Amborella trichopoda]